jgi:hypothetical protein
MTDHLAADAQGNPYTAPGFDHVAHDRWVRDGFCPVVSVSRAYCGKRPGHSGNHGSAIVRSADTGDVGWLEWDT